MFYAQYNFSQGILCYAVSYFEKIWLILIKCYFQATGWAMEESWFDFSIGKGDFYLSTICTPAVGLTQLPI
jgi:hypothetical protein